MAENVEKKAVKKLSPLAKAKLAVKKATADVKAADRAIAKAKSDLAKATEKSKKAKLAEKDAIAKVKELEKADGCAGHARHCDHRRDTHEDDRNDDRSEC